MMEVGIYMIRCLVMFLITWAGVRILGKKTIGQMTAYELAGLMLLTTIAAEPLVVKISFKAAVGVLIIATCTIAAGWFSLSRIFYNLDSKPGIVIVKGQVDHKVLRKNQINFPFFLSLLREKGYFSLNEIEYAILEPNGTLSVVTSSQVQPVKRSDLHIDAPSGITLPLVIDGQLQDSNISFVGLTKEWFMQEMDKAGIKDLRKVMLAEYGPKGEVHFHMYSSNSIRKPSLQ